MQPDRIRNHPHVGDWHERTRPCGAALLINPTHPAIRRVRVRAAEPFAFDRRLPRQEEKRTGRAALVKPYLNRTGSGMEASLQAPAIPDVEEIRDSSLHNGAFCCGIS
jgi:hypothetical protein